FSIEVDSGDPLDLAKSFAKELVNENKESHKVHIGDLVYEDDYVPVKVALHIEDGEAISIRERLHSRLGFSNVVDVKKATVWKLSIKRRAWMMRQEQNTVPSSSSWKMAWPALFRQYFLKQFYDIILEGMNPPVGLAKRVRAVWIIVVASDMRRLALRGKSDREN
ncbi:MAG: hypothetical protein LUQ51_01510, partial [Methanothrix sp.]